MISRGTVLAAILVAELAIVGTAITAVRGDQMGPSFGPPGFAQLTHGSHLIEGGPHQIFDTGSHPSLTVDIGYADLTILTGKASQIDVSVSPSRDYGLFRSRAPISARQDVQTVRVASAPEHGLSVGDNRMVTVVVPIGTKVTVVHAGDITANGLRAEASLSSLGNGFIRVEDYDGPVLHLTASRGPIIMHAVTVEHLDASARDDRVDGTALRVHDGNIESGDRVTLGFASGTNTVVNAITDDGKATASGFSTGASVAGSRKDDDDDSSSETVRVGTGNGSLDVHTTDGNINLVQEN
ncbi:MAG: hypothetical protein ABSE64_03945 [Vulcanimicrobiaceae bacterium]